MLVPIIFRDKNGFPCRKDAATVLYARARGQNCELYFENGEVEIYGYPLIDFHKKVWGVNLYRRLGKFLLVKTEQVKSQKWLQLIFRNGTIIKLTLTAHNRLKDYLEKHPPAG